MNNKGFTLIELLATLAVLAILVSLSYVSISKIIVESRNKECLNTKNGIIYSAKEYYSDIKYSFSENELNITAEELYNKKYLANKVHSPYTKSEVNMGDIKVIILLNSDRSIKEINVDGFSCNE